MCRQGGLRVTCLRFKFNNQVVFTIGVLTIIKEVKAIHPEYVALIKTGNFYCVYGKDASIISNLFKYQFKEISDTISCGFPVSSIKKVQAKLENYEEFLKYFSFNEEE